MPTYVRLLPLALLSLAACSSGGDDPQDDAGTAPVVDLCNSREEALTLAECELTPGQTLERFLAQAGDVPAGDQDWYRIVLPANTSARTLLNVNGVYAAASTAVNLSITVLGPLPPDEKEGALAKKEDKHAQGAPRPVDMVLPLREGLASQTLLVLVQDSPDVPTRPNYDARNPYRLTMQLMENPDSQEPNDTRETATPLPLVAQGDQQVGTATGYLATDNDVDHFSFDLPAGKVAYVRASAPDQGFVPNWRLAYELRRPSDGKESEDQVRPQVRGGVVATARKVEEAGTWTLVVKGYRPSEREAAQGDLHQRYEVEVRVMDEADPQDIPVRGNNAVADATARSLEGSSPGSPGAAVSFTGRIGYTEDDDWYSVRLPPSTVPTLLRYRVVPLGTGGRFPPLPSTPDRLVRVFTLVAKGATLDDWRINCVSDATACPKGYGESPDARQLVEGFCTRTDLPAPMCTHSSREEVVDDPRFANLSNLRGVIPVPKHTSAVTYYFVVQDEGTNWADDRDYRLEVAWEAEDADELARNTGDEEQPVGRQLEETSAFPFPPADGAYSMSGQLSHGYGRLRSGTDRRDGLGVRGPADYDAVPSDVDSYLFQLPSVPTAPEDRAWLLQWEVDKLADGGTPHGLALDLTFCDGDRMDSGTCMPVTVGSRNQPLTLGYTPDALRAWHTPSGASVSSLQPLFILEDRPGSTVVTLAPYACGCLERRFIRGGTLRVDVTASERLDYERVNYTLRTAHAAYPQSYTRDGGTSVSCPPVVTDGGTLLDDGGVQPVYAGGCNFTRQP